MNDVTKAANQAFEPVPGVPLRDWFAGQALAGLLAHGGYSIRITETVFGLEAAQRCYIIADAMIAARNAAGG